MKTNTLRTCTLALILGAFLVIPSTAFSQNNRVMGQLRFGSHGWVNDSAGVWVDAQYVGYVKELHGDRTVYLLPGKHTIEVREGGYQEISENLVVSPGATYGIAVDLQKSPQFQSTANRAGVQTFVSPGRAAIFVDDMYIGYANEFRSGSNEILLVPGKHKIVIALPGYHPFKTEVSLRPNQLLQIATDLQRGSVLDSGTNPGAASTDEPKGR